MENTLGSRISQLRKEKGLTQEELAQHLDVSPQAVSKWENDLPGHHLPAQAGSWWRYIARRGMWWRYDCKKKEWQLSTPFTLPYDLFYLFCNVQSQLLQAK